MSKFKSGDRVVGTHGWGHSGVGTVIERKDDDIYEAYIVVFDTYPHARNTPYAEYLRKLTKLELALS